MKNKLKQILAELYEIDPELKQDQEKLKKIIITMLESKPEIKIDSKFVSQLKAELEEKASEMSQSEKAPVFSGWKNLAFAVGGAVVCLAIVLPFINSSNVNIDNNLKLSDSGIKITRAGREMFGKLNFDASGNRSDVLGRGAGDGSSAELGINSMPNQTGGATKPMIYQPRRYVYNYVGEDLVLQDEYVEVLKKDKSGDMSRQLGSMLSGLDFADIDLDKFSNLKVDSLNLVEDKKDGYAIYADFNNGNFHIRRELAQPRAASVDSEGFTNRRIKPGEVAEADKLISISDKFLNNKNISTDIYGEPFVDYDYQQAILKSSYAPQNVSVVYPLEINNLLTYGSWGKPYGLSVSISTSENEVVSVGTIEIHNYIGSSYPAIREDKKILDYAYHGGQGSHFDPDDSNIEIIDLEISTPEKIYVKSWNYNNETRQSEELLIPALRFPVVETPNDYYGKENIIVPLVEGIINEPVFRIMDEPSIQIDTMSVDE